MSTQWLRLWHDMPNDPKWRTISRISGQPIALVQAVYLHLLVDASRNVTRGHVTVTAEDLSSALDVTEDAIKAIQDAMQGRVLDGNKLSGWDGRQPKREDPGNEETGAKSAAERKREQRQRQREAKELSGSQPVSRQCHDESRNVPLDKDKDTDKPTSLRSVGESSRDTGDGLASLTTFNRRGLTWRKHNRQAWIWRPKSIASLPTTKPDAKPVPTCKPGRLNSANGCSTSSSSTPTGSASPTPRSEPQTVQAQMLAAPPQPTQ
ncbi:hypothetical protein [Chromobacterium haemolyticum]|uniref:hypothetical protein n=1 Tax=Chromobacterium haemolyticum TaxID=394935 RepID=UPI001965E2B4|nr:hypothetical protein [Chromobacterium haemolyticum]